MICVRFALVKSAEARLLRFVDPLGQRTVVYHLQEGCPFVDPQRLGSMFTQGSHPSDSPAWGSPA